MVPSSDARRHWPALAGQQERYGKMEYDTIDYYQALITELKAIVPAAKEVSAVIRRLQSDGPQPTGTHYRRQTFASDHQIDMYYALRKLPDNLANEIEAAIDEFRDEIERIEEETK